MYTKRKGNGTMKQMLKDYRATSAADKYILTFENDDRIFAIVLDEIPDRFIKLDRESKSHGGARKLRLTMTETNKKILLDMGAKDIGSTAEILSLRKNKGEAVEKFLTEKAGQVWVKESIPYYKDGDLTVNGIRYQIKFGNASLANEDTIRKAVRLKAAA